MKYNDNNLGKQWLLFFFIPLFSFISTIKYVDRKAGRVLIVLFCCLVGWLMSPYSQDQDLYRYYEKFEVVSSWNAHTYGINLADYLMFNSGKKDFYFETVTYFCSRLTDNPHFYYLIFGLVFGLFFSKSLSIMISNFYKKGGKMDTYSGIFFFLIIFSIPFMLISSIRFWTAAWVSIYVALKVLVENKPLYSFWLLLALFIHGTYLIFIVLFGLSYLLSRTDKFTYFLVVLVYLSIPFSYLSFSVIDSVAQYIPGFLEDTAEVYVGRASNDPIVGTGFAWVSNIFHEAIKIFDYILIILLTTRRKQGQDEYYRLYIILLVILAFGNFTSNVPSLGGRFFNLDRPILYFMCLMTFQDKQYYRLMKLVPIIYSFSVVYMFYYEIPGTIGLFSLFTPPIISLFKFL